MFNLTAHRQVRAIYVRPFLAEGERGAYACNEDFAESQSDDLTRAYLHQIGLVRLLNRQTEAELGLRMERGRWRMRKALSRCPLVQAEIAAWAEAASEYPNDLNLCADNPDSEFDPVANDRLFEIVDDVKVLHVSDAETQTKHALFPGIGPGSDLFIGGSNRDTCRHLSLSFRCCVVETIGVPRGTRLYRLP